MTTETAGIREIDTGALPDRYARGWHCLGPVQGLPGRQAARHQRFSAPCWSSSPTPTATSRSSTATAGTWAATSPRAPSRATRSPARSTTGAGAATASASWCPTPSAPPGWPARVRGQPTSAAACCSSGTTTKGNPPQAEVRIPEIPEFASDDWTDWRWNSILIEGSNCRDIIDNVTDMAHFFYIHFGLPTYFKNVFEGHIASQYLHNVGRPDINDMGTTYGEAHLDSEASYFGPSFMINWLHNSYGGFKAESILINCHYPVSQNSFMLQWGVIVEKPKGLDEETTDKLARVFTEGVSKGFLQDVEIWKHKTRIDNPLLVEEDGAVYQMRRWYQQFYVDVADVTPDMTDRFEIEIDTTAANEKWHVEVEENLKRQAERKRNRPARKWHPASEAPDVDQLARSMLRLYGAHDDEDGHHDEAGNPFQGTEFRVRPRPCRRGAGSHAARPRAIPDLGAGVCRLPVLSRRGSGEEARPRPHVRAVELRSLTALRVLHRDPGVRRRIRPRPVVPEARRQHQTRCGRGLSGGSLQCRLPRRRLVFCSASLLGGCTHNARRAPVAATAARGTHYRATGRRPVEPEGARQGRQSVHHRRTTKNAAAWRGRWTRPSSSTSIRRQPTVGTGYRRAAEVHRRGGRRLSRRLRREARASGGKAHHRIVSRTCRSPSPTCEDAEYHFRLLPQVNSGSPDIVLWSFTADDWACDNAFVAAHNAAVENLDVCAASMATTCCRWLASVETD